MNFDPLPGSLREVEEISTLWSRGIAVKPSSSPEPSLKLTGAAVDEGIIKREAHGHRILHLATHAFFVGDSCRSVSSSPVGSPRAGLIENPLLRSGLVLAGANNRSRAGEDQEDGIFTAEEIASLDMSDTELVVLSGCDTARGRATTGEGVLGLRRGFEIAGAETLIMSLWPVQDEIARRWMRELYTARFDGLTTSDAVRRASLRILEERRAADLSTHPFFWGAFVAAGDWR